MQCVDLFLSGSFEDMGIFYVFELSFDGGRGVISTHNIKIDQYVKKNADIIKGTTKKNQHSA